MKRTLLFALALIADGCADARQSALCQSYLPVDSLEDRRICAEQGRNSIPDLTRDLDLLSLEHERIGEGLQTSGLPMGDGFKSHSLG